MTTKKMLIGILLAAVVAGSALIAVPAFAQGENPPREPSGPWPFYRQTMRGRFERRAMIADGETGWLHDAMVSAVADALGLPVEELEARLDGGETMLSIALDEGRTLDEARELLFDARAAAWDEAEAAGVDLPAFGSATPPFGSGDCLMDGSMSRAPFHGRGAMGPAAP